MAGEVVYSDVDKQGGAIVEFARAHEQVRDKPQTLNPASARTEQFDKT
jgi:hypothetical protein